MFVIFSNPIPEMEQEGVLLAVEGYVLHHVHCRQRCRNRRAVPVEDFQDGFLL